jgi:hypothetical protein
MTASRIFTATRTACRAFTATRTACRAFTATRTACRAFTATRTACRAFAAALRTETAAAPEVESEPLPVQPTTEEIAAAIETFETNRAAENAAHRAKETAAKIVAHLAPGIYGDWEIRFTPGHKINDSAAVKEFFAAHNAEVPSKTSAPSVKVTAREHAAA